MKEMNNYILAIISIVLITLITVFSITFETKKIETAGQAYLTSNTEYSKNTIKIERSPGMIKIYQKTEPERYAYLRND
ncbi:MAG: hypothetical protein KatS3mg002_0183 [Candidatus Woesearchaeota archaeon]|nr:MAG: hypothetical protein KatS3mg002_0183 [Candidatus Woesearchaeota archaeon]